MHICISPKNLNGVATGPRKKFGDIFSHLDTIKSCQPDMETDGQTDRQTSADGKDRAYA